MQVDFFSHNGKLSPIDQAVVPLSNIEYSYGFGVYETIRVSDGIVYFLGDHVERLLESARIIGLEHTFSSEFVARGVRELVDKVSATACNVKVLLIGSRTADGAQLYVQCLNPLFPDRKLYKSGAHFITYEHERLFPHAKSLNMLPSYLAYRKAKQAAAYDALLINHTGNIVEGTRTNFFALQGNTIISPPDDQILLGVMRKAMLKVAAENGFEMLQQDIRLDDLDNYDCAFVTSTSSKIMPARTIDDHVFGETSESLQKLMQALGEFLASCGGKF